jgi:hypothetical protein
MLDLAKKFRLSPTLQLILPQQQYQKRSAIALTPERQNPAKPQRLSFHQPQHTVANVIKHFEL